MRTTVKHIELPANRRAFAISDVHGNLDYLKGLLNKINFCEQDILILLGDLIEKGPQSIDTLQYVMNLCKTHTVHALRGNCDRLLFDDSISPQWLFRYRNSWGGHSIMNEFAQRLNLSLDSPEAVIALRAKAKQEFPEEFAFLMDLPVILESEHYIFVHGGIPGEDSLANPDALEPWSCMKNDDFVNQGHSFRRKWCVVGHWPATLYQDKFPCANPLISPEQQIASIDGGCVIKRDGQLNALHLPTVPRADTFTWTSYDSLPTATAATAQGPSAPSINVRFGDNELSVVKRGEEFCSCIHLSSGTQLDILTKDLWETEHGVFCEDSTNYRLPVQPGDLLSIIEETSRGWLVKKDGVTGWYAGTLLREG